MPIFDSETRSKIEALRAIRAAHGDSNPYEVVRVHWPAPTGPINYTVLDLQLIAADHDVTLPAEIEDYDIRIIPDSSPDWFLQINQDASIGDEEVDINFWDADGVLSDLLVDHGEGVKVEILYWFPQVELLLPTWHGHLRNEEEATVDVLPVKIAQGFRSGESDVPGRAHYPTCQAIYGANFATQEEIDEHDCPSNHHIGGPIGIDNPATGLPWTFCNRLDLQSCIDRGVPPEYHLSHRTISVTVANNQTSGPNLFSTSHGNETNLKEPVRVVMGERRIYDMKPMVTRKDLNNNNPAHGWFAALYEGSEGPVESITMAKIEVGGVTQDAVALHFAIRTGQKGQTPLWTPITTHAYAGTSYFLYNFGWVDPRNLDAGDAKGSAFYRGLNNIRVYSDETTYTEQHTRNRAWQIMRVMADKRWGFGYDYARFNKASWIATAAWGSTEPAKRTSTCMTFVPGSAPNC